MTIEDCSTTVLVNYLNNKSYIFLSPSSLESYVPSSSSITSFRYWTSLVRKTVLLHTVICSHLHSTPCGQWLCTDGQANIEVCKPCLRIGLTFKYNISSPTRACSATNDTAQDANHRVFLLFYLFFYKDNIFSTMWQQLLFISQYCFSLNSTVSRDVQFSH